MVFDAAGVRDLHLDYPKIALEWIRVQILSVFAVWALLRPWATALLRTTAHSCMTKRAVEPSVQKQKQVLEYME